MSLFTDAPYALLVFSGALLLCMAPAWRYSRHDGRTIRGVGVWAKPLKFAAALALFSISTAVLMLAAGDTQETRAALWRIAALIIATSTFELAYITVQASRAQPSHYNTSDPFHTMMTLLMAVGAIALTASQPWLAWVIIQSRQDWLSSVSALGIVAGLILTFPLTAISGFLLGSHRAPAGRGLPVLGWQRRDDLRPAHFMGVHAQQFIPGLGLLADRLLGNAAHAGFAAFACAYVLAWATLTRMQLKRWRAAVAAA